MEAQRTKAVGVIQAAWRAYAPYHLLASFRNLLHAPPSLASGEHARTVQHLTTYLTTGPAQAKEDFLNRAQALGFYPFAAVDRADDDDHNNRRGPAEVLWSELLHADNGRALVKAGSVPFLIQSLVSDYGGVEQTFLEDFLLTYRTFLTPHALLLLLILRYWVPLGDKDDKREERDKKQRIPIQIKTVRVLRMWIENVPTDFTDDDVLTANATSFLTGIETFKVASGEILNMLREKRNPGATQHEDDTHAQPMLTSRGQSDGPERGQVVNFERAEDSNEDGDSDGGLADGQKPKPAGRSDRSFLSFDAADVAFEWTLSAQRFYRAVTPREFIKQAWNKKAKLELAPNVSALIEDFNQMSEWVSLVVLSYRDRKRRGEAISRFINIAYECHRLKNYHTVMVILSGLTKAHITRLKKSWELVDNRAKSKLKLLNELMGMDSNYQQYRLALREIVPPTPSVPFLGLFLTDLTFLDEGNSELMSSTSSSSSSSTSSSTSTSVTSPSSSDNSIRTSSKRRSFFKVKSDRSVRLESKLRDLSASHSKEDLSASAALIEKSTMAPPDMSGASPRHSVHGGSSASNKRLSLLHKKGQIEKSEDGEKRLSMKSVRSLSVYMKGTSEKMRNLRGRKSTSTFATMDESELLSGWRAEESPRLTPEEQAAVQAWKQLDAQPSADSCMQESGDSFVGGRRSRRAHTKRMPQVFDWKELSEALVKEEKELSSEADTVTASPVDKEEKPSGAGDKQDEEVHAPNKAEKTCVCEEEMLINWMKQRTMAKVLREFLRFQHCSYPLPKKRGKVIRRKLKGKLERKSGAIDHSDLTKEPTTLLSSGTALDFEGFADDASDAGMAELEEIRDMLREMRLPPDISNVLDLSTYLPSPASVIPPIPFTQSASSETRTPRGSSSTGNSPRSRSATSLSSHTSVTAIEALARVTEDQFKSPRASMIATSRTPPSLSPRGPSVSIKRTTSMPTITVIEEPSTAEGASFNLDLTSTTRTFTPRATPENHAELFTMKKLKLDDSLLFDLSLHLEPRAGSQVGGAADKKAPALFVISSPQSSPAATYRARNKIDRTMVGADSDEILAVVVGEEVLPSEQPSADSGTAGCRIKQSKSSDALTPTASPTARRKNESDDSSPLMTDRATRVVKPTKEEGRPRSNTTSLLPAETSASAEESERWPKQRSAAHEAKKERRHKDDTLKAKEAVVDDDEGGGGVVKKASKTRKLLKSKKSKERIDA